MNKISIFACFLLCGCIEVLDKIQEVGSTPPLARIQNPYDVGYEPIDMPMPTPQNNEKKRVGSLWKDGAKSFFKDQRASKKGDIVLVSVDMKNSAQWSDSTKTTKSSKVTSALNNLITQFNGSTSVPPTFNPAKIVDAKNDPTSKGDARIKHDFTIGGMKIPAIIVQILPNGLMVVFGSREIRFHKSKERIVVMGIANQSNINADNVIPFERLAEARLIKAGQGDMEDAMRMPLLQEFMNKLWPF